MPISKELIGAQNYSANKLCAKCSWNTEGLDGNYDIRVTLFDDEDNSDCVEVMYTVTSSGPKPPQNLKAETDNGVIMLTWNKSVSADCQNTLYTDRIPKTKSLNQSLRLEIVQLSDIQIKT